MHILDHPIINAVLVLVLIELVILWNTKESLEVRFKKAEAQAKKKYEVDSFKRKTANRPTSSQESFKQKY